MGHLLQFAQDRLDASAGQRGMRATASERCARREQTLLMVKNHPPPSQLSGADQRSGKADRRFIKAVHDRVMGHVAVKRRHADLALLDGLKVRPRL